MPSDSKSLAGKVAWITGGGSGIGLAAGLELARAGAHVVLSGRSAETLKKAQKEVKAETIVLDVADRKQVAATAQKILKQHGGIDILVNSAGINLPQRNFRNVSVEGWDEIVAINLSGTFYPCHAVLPAMREKKQGLIINIASWFGRLLDIDGLGERDAGQPQSQHHAIIADGILRQHRQVWPKQRRDHGGAEGRVGPVVHRPADYFALIIDDLWLWCDAGACRTHLDCPFIECIATWRDYSGERAV